MIYADLLYFWKLTSVGLLCWCTERLQINAANYRKLLLGAKGTYIPIKTISIRLLNVYLYVIFTVNLICFERRDLTIPNINLVKPFPWQPSLFFRN